MLVFFAGAAPVLLHGPVLLPQGTYGFDRGPSFRHRPLFAPPPDRVTVYAALTLVHVCAHGAGEGETQPGRGFLCSFVSAAKVHGEDVLGQREGGRLTGLWFVSRKQALVKVIVSNTESESIL